MITKEELVERQEALKSAIKFAEFTDAQVTKAALSKDLALIELALIGLRRSELNND